MGLRKVEVALVCAVLVAMLCAGAAARSSCSSALTSLSPCLNFVVGNSSNPSSSCCSQLDNVVQTQAECLCEVLNGTIAALGVTINKTLALALPKACNAQTAPATECDGNGNSVVLYIIIIFPSFLLHQTSTTCFFQQF
ncbi:hypothetical protein Ancab_013322 [Ancistrocladus abbreviatus]